MQTNKIISLERSIRLSLWLDALKAFDGIHPIKVAEHSDAFGKWLYTIELDKDIPICVSRYNNMIINAKPVAAYQSVYY